MNRTTELTALSAVNLLSATSKVPWPAVLLGRPAQELAMQAILDESQWLTADTILQQQLQQLHSLLQFALQEVPFYRDRLSQSGFADKDHLTVAVWRKLPVLKRDDLQAAGDAINASRLPKEHGKPGEVRSSGSTGRAVTVQKTALCNLFFNAFCLRDHIWQQRNISGKLAVIKHFKKKLVPGQAMTIPDWGAGTHGIYRTGEAVLVDSSTDINTLGQWLLREQPRCLLCYPSILSAMASNFLEQGTLLSGLQHIVSFGETLSQDQRDLCQQAFAVRPEDMYAAEEIGYIALQCPLHEHYHVQAEGVFVEVLDEQDQPCRPGEIGRVVVTPLHNFATPLIRYELGDYAEVGDQCDCGRGLPVLKRILGRVRNMLTLPTGGILWPALRSKDYASTAGADIRQVQLIQHSLEHIEVRLVVSPPLQAQQELKLTALIQEALGHPFSLSFSYLDEIPRSKTGKFEVFMSHIL